ncbi:DNA polymerase IV [Geosmithia morbida]|uniref:DNA polymerase n=1 Tax=Geosmithia morbida TaxID=1094350 RepID=A0A9P4YTI6_9HYPO|nr:DNA polymerase IV [Geosmithia morbida]KAF4121780.1 DNA polymerase IV [Geosmithia morbida]
MSLNLPHIYLLPTNLKPEELHSLESKVPSLTSDTHEAEVIVGRITRRERALFELRRLKLSTKEKTSAATPKQQEQSNDGTPPTKRRRVSASGAASGSDDDATVKVVKLQWLTDSLEQGVVLPVAEYLLFEGKRQKKPQPQALAVSLASDHPASPSSPVTGRRETELAPSSSEACPSSHPRVSGHQERALVVSSSPRTSRPPPSLVHETTSEHDTPLPPVPDYLHTTYSCQRPTPVDTPNAAFIEQMKKLRTIRVLEGDGIGVRAYSTSIATVAAYPHHVRSSFEILRLPGCGPKIADLFQQWKETGRLREVAEAEADARMSTLKLFYGIWGVGDTTARDFYNKGWRDLDDLVVNAWRTLSRVQQIGVKYYDELQLKIPRSEVERIGNTILSEAHKLDSGYQATIVGSYRRGKAQSGDVDIIISHQDERRTWRLVEKLVAGLEKSKHITHTLTLSTANSERGQVPLPWKGGGGGGAYAGTTADGTSPSGPGFDTLDKALVVWQDPDSSDDAPAPHRRVDIIVSPWKTVGCTVLGWTGGTTFQRDLRRYCKRRGLKFDSSGVRRRSSGAWVDLEKARQDASSVAPDMESAEKRVFHGLGLAWRDPHDRCTG